MPGPDALDPRPAGPLVDLVTGILGAVRRWSPLGSGLDHRAWRADTDDGTWVIRTPLPSGSTTNDDASGPDATRPDAALTRAARAAGLHWAPELRDLPPLPGQPDGVTAHRLVPGRSLLDAIVTRPPQRPVPERDLARLGRQLGGFVAALGRIPADGLGLPIDEPEPTAWLEGAVAALATLDDVVDGQLAVAVRRALDAPPPAFPVAEQLVVAHHDLGAEHVLVDGSLAVTGVIDWSDAAVTDPAADLGRILRDLGEGAFRAATVAWSAAGGSGAPGPVAAGSPDHPAVSPLPSRARWYARCLAVEDLAFSIEHRPDAVGFGVERVRQLFAAPRR